MSIYYVNKEPTFPSIGEHEVHKDGCFRMPSKKLYLGVFNNAIEAVRKCQKDNPTVKIDGCKHCCPEAHTK